MDVSVSFGLHRFVSLFVCANTPSDVSHENWKAMISPKESSSADSKGFMINVLPSYQKELEINGFALGRFSLSNKKMLPKNDNPRV